jgi:hypothetical protein
MSVPLFYPSLTRISPLVDGQWKAESLDRGNWATGDYVVCTADPGGKDELELVSGRMMQVSSGDRFVGVLGDRRATVEVTGSWREIGKDGLADVLTSAGLIGKMTSRAPSLPDLIQARYEGHVMVDGEKATMRRFVQQVEERPFTTPVVLLTGTSMSAGKTATARVIIRRLTKKGLRVLGAKITGAGRYRDIQSMADAGAEWIYDFVDVGLPSTVCPGTDYRQALVELASMMARHEADVAVIEIGASPLEAYNGVIAIESIRPLVRCTALAASDPYAAFGVMHAFEIEPDFVCGPAVNTDAGADLVEKLCAVPPLNVVNDDAIPPLDEILARALGMG